MTFEEKTLSSEVIYRGKIVTLKRDRVLLPNGKESVREVVEHPGGACVLCVEEGKVALVKQFRYAYGEELFELPAGKLNPGEEPVLCARRELEEETGLVAKELSLLFVLYPSPGYFNEKLYVFEAKGFEKGTEKLDEDEFLSCCFLPVEKALSMIERGEIKDGKTVAALLFYAARKN